MKLISWNVNGLRACLKKGFEDVVRGFDADFFCIQETKMQQGQAEVDLPDYEEFYCSADKKGYSGTAIYAKESPMSVQYNFGEHTDEGRSIILEYEKFYLVNVYVPNSQEKLKRLDYRMKWEDDIREFLTTLSSIKPVVMCGDLNVAHREIDLKNPASNRGNAGFSDEERGKFGELLEAGFVDTFRYLYPDKEGVYSWWSYRFNARRNNAGWRIDYFIVSESLKDKIKEATIHTEIFGSDHCPVELDIELEI
ncbi:exodeoxyribonuclease III [Eubacterium minutum ATCC 700079]|nr:exodeoxyribonuclease III [Eubacterium minutum ATCC 700079]